MAHEHERDALPIIWRYIYIRAFDYEVASNSDYLVYLGRVVMVPLRGSSWARGEATNNWVLQ